MVGLNNFLGSHNYEAVRRFETEVRLGNIAGMKYVGIIGHQEAVTTAFTTLYPAATPQLFEALEAAGSTIAVASSDAEDKSDGTGARTCSVSGLDGNGNEISETVTMNGQTKVALTRIWNIVHTIQVLTAGSNGENAGIISIGLNADTFTSGVPTTLHACMEATWNLSRLGWYQIPTGKKGYITSLVIFCGVGKVGEVRLVQTANATGLDYNLIELGEKETTIHISSADNSPALAAGDIIRCDGKVSATTGPIMMTVVILLVDD